MTDASEPTPETDRLVGELTLDEKAAISSGSGFFTMTGVERLGIPNWGTTDGPNGARGSSLLGSGESKATCVPSGSALGATWNPALVEEIGALLGRETRTKACRVLLAPTVNLHRSPIAGRNFECFSEDPLLAGELAAAYIRGVQSEGVVTTVKHFVGNETETDRWTSDSRIGPRALRELYLVPFEYAVTRGGTLGVMTAYNRLNGWYCTEQEWLLNGLLRDEWGFEGFVTTDWLAAADTVGSAQAGLDLEMPFGDRAFGTKVAEAVREGRVPEEHLDRIVAAILGTMERVGALHDEPRAETSIDVPEHRELARRAAGDAMVLLRNEPVDDTPVLPLAPAALGTIAVLGPNAAKAQMMGGGSANLRPFHRTSPLDAIGARLGDSVEIVHAPGCDIDMTPPLLGGAELTSPSGESGFDIEVFDGLDWAGEPLGVVTRDTSRFVFGDDPVPGHAPDQYSFRGRATFRPVDGGEFTFELIQVSPSRVFVDGELVLDGMSVELPLSDAFFGFGTVPVRHTMEVEAGRAYEIVVEGTAEEIVAFAGFDVRVRRPQSADPIGDAAALAASADAAVVVVGTNDDWETEGEDRTSLSLPGDQDALVDAVVAANPRTVVVVNTGAPVTMPWADRVPAIVQAWFGGQEMGDALVDVLIGEVDPGGRLPTTFPVRIEHAPSFGDFPGDNGKVDYQEGIFVGYRWYGSRALPVLFPFGAGGSYTTFEVGEPTLSSSSIVAGESVTVTVPVTNTGDRRGRHVVQCYVRPHRSKLVRPERELKGFGKVELDPGETATVTMTLDDRAFAYWDPAQPEWTELRERISATLPQYRDVERRTEPGWTIDAGDYDIVIARDALTEDHTATLTIT